MTEEFTARMATLIDSGLGVSLQPSGIGEWTCELTFTDPTGSGKCKCSGTGTSPMDALQFAEDALEMLVTLVRETEE